MREAERIYARTQSLAQKSFASEAEMTRSEARVNVLRAQLNQARLNSRPQSLKPSGTARCSISTDPRPLQRRGGRPQRTARGDDFPPLGGRQLHPTGICTIVDMDSIEIEVDVNEAFIGRVRKDGAVAAVLDAYPEWTIPAYVIAIVPTANREKATVRVRIGFREKDPRILPDMAVKVTFLEGDGLAGARRPHRRSSRPKPARTGEFMSMSDILVALLHVSKGFVKGRETIDIFERLDLTIPTKDFVAVMGPSGSGKTTLLNLLGGIDRPDGGEIHIAGMRIDTLSEGNLARWRAANIGFVFQFYNLMPMLTAAQNVELPLLLTNLHSAERREHVETALKIVNLADRAKHYPREMSGGQQQRVAIARAIVSDPKLLLCDEPTGDLDRHSADEILGMLSILNRELGKTIVMVTHDPAAARYARRILHLDKGHFVEKELAA